jgi:hypothetical protein
MRDGKAFSLGMSADTIERQSSGLYQTMLD